MGIDVSIRSDAQLAGSQLRVIPIGEGKDGRLQSALLGNVSLLEPELEEEAIRAGSYAYALIAECYANQFCAAGNELRSGQGLGRRDERACAAVCGRGGVCSH